MLSCCDIAQQAGELTLCFAGQFLNEMQEVGELSPAASPVKSPSARAAGFAALMEEADVAARAPVGPHADAEAGQQPTEQGPSQEAEESAEASTHGLRGGSAAEANGGPSHAASGELEGTEHLHSNGGPSSSSAVGCGSDSHGTAPMSAEAAKAAAPQHLGREEAAVQSGVAAQQEPAAPTEPSKPADVVDAGGQPTASSAISQSVEILGQPAGSSADRSVDILGEAVEVSAERGDVLSQAKRDAPPAGPASGAQQKGGPSAAAAAEAPSTAAQSAATAGVEEQQFTCDVCTITTSSEAHMQARARQQQRTHPAVLRRSPHAPSQLCRQTQLALLWHASCSWHETQKCGPVHTKASLKRHLPA
jgi:hypothetical protein